MRKDEYTEELVMTIMDLFSKGIDDPSIDEICSAHFPNKHIPGEILASVKQRLPRIKAMLESMDYEVYFVNLSYYIRFRSIEPETAEEAKERLPIGGGRNQEKAHRHGIRRCKDAENDLMWQETIRNNMGTANGKRKMNKDRVKSAERRLGLSHDTAAKLLNATGGVMVSGENP